MAIRKPLYYDAGDLKEMTTAMVNTIVAQCVYQYSLDPGVALSVVSSGGTLGSLTDTRQQAGAVSTHHSSFPTEATTAEPTTVTVTYDKITQSLSPGSPASDTGWLWPAYNTSANETQAMTLQDVKDTFLHPAINLLVDGNLTSSQAGTYHINSSASLSGSTRVSSNPVFINTQANTSAYTVPAAGSNPNLGGITGLGFTLNKTYISGGSTGTNTVTLGDVNDVTIGMGFWRQDNGTLPDRSTTPTTITEINGNTLTLSQNFTSQASGISGTPFPGTYRIGGEALDQPSTVTNYYLYKINGSSSSVSLPLYIRQADSDLQSYSDVNFKSYLQQWMKKTAAESGDGFKIAYSYTTGTNRGSGMADTILSGSGDYQTFQYTADSQIDDYRAQEFPSGSPTTSNTYFLKIRKL